MTGRMKTDVNKAYALYKQRIEQRIKNGEDIKVKPRTEWEKIVERGFPDGKVVKTIVPGESGETKNEKALRLGNSRISKVLSTMKSLKMLAISPQYVFTSSQVTYITEKIAMTSQDLIDAFSGKKEEIKTKTEIPV